VLEQVLVIEHEISRSGPLGLPTRSFDAVVWRAFVRPTGCVAEGDKVIWAAAISILVSDETGTKVRTLCDHHVKVLDPQIRQRSHHMAMRFRILLTRMRGRESRGCGKGVFFGAEVGDGGLPVFCLGE